MSIWRLDGAIIGAMVSWKGQAPFHRASLVLELPSPEQTLVRVNRYLGNEVAGESLTREEWQTLIRVEEAMDLRAQLGVVSDAWAWMLRSGLVLNLDGMVATLTRANALLAEPIKSVSGDLTLVVLEPRVAGLREAWANEAARLSHRAFCQGDDAKALVAAKAAFNLEPTMSPRRIALLAYAYRRLQRARRADGYILMANRSRGPEFANEVLEEMKLLERELSSARAISAFKKCRLEALSHSPMLRGTAA